MGKKLLTSILLLLFAVATASAERVELGTNATDVTVTVLESNDSKTVIEYEIGSFDKETVDINGEIYYRISLESEANSLVKGEPSLPKINRGIIIPDNAAMEFNVINVDYVDFPEIMVAPSKGSIPRTILPEEVPYTFGDSYQTSDWSPKNIAGLSDPFIFRDYRGTLVQLNPFQYHPVNKTLRVIKSVTVEINNVGQGQINVFNRAENEIKLVSDFNLMYQRHFINYDNMRDKYPSVSEFGDILIITYDSFHDAMLPLVEWKLQKGIKTTIVDVSTIGNTSSQIKTYITNFYNTNNLAFVLLVGDGAQIDVPYSNGDSDPSYGKLVGSDNYPEILVGRFSAENIAHVETQVLRSVNYEKTPYGTDWFQKATGVASNQGPGDDNEYDNEHLDNIRALFLAYGFTEVDQIYDPSATSSMVSTALNNGRSVVNYTGHGSTTSWSSSGFSNSHVNALTNDWMLPIIASVACVNGDFDGPTCFAEAWLRATNGGNPTGAIATYMSTINQDWDEPMEGQDAINDLLVTEEKTTVGGLFVNGGCQMLETYPSAGVDDFDTWTIFGDPSVQVRIKNPQALTVSHDAAHVFTLPTFDVTVTGIEGALCALYHDGTLYGSAYTDAGGLASITIEGDLPIGSEVTVTVTAYHMMPYIGSVQIIAPEGPFVVYDNNVIDDILGNNDGIVNCGESISLDVTLTNVGPDIAYNVNAVLSTGDEYVTITDDTEIYGEIPGDFGTTEIIDAFAFDVSEDMPNDHIIDFNLAITGSDTRDTTWNMSFSIEGHCYPDMSVDPYTFVDSLSLDDLTVDTIMVTNDGHAPLEIQFTTYDSWLDFAPGVQTVAPHDNMAFEVAVSSVNMPYGDSYGSIDFSTNDMLNSSGSVTFQLYVFSPDIAVSELDIAETVATDELGSHELFIYNNGPGTLEYNITRLMFNGKRSSTVAKETVLDPIGYRPADAEKSISGEQEPYYPPQTRGVGGPDLWGYNWVDSDEPDGPTYEWIDISGVGTAVDSLGDDDTTNALPLGFSFPFYENYYSELYIGSNGIITFGTPSKVRTNTALPYTLVPNNLISMWWDDLDPRKGGQIYYYYDAANERFIASFDGIPNYSSTTGTGSLSFQAILYTNGKIKLQYGVMDPGDDYYGLTGGTVGIENSTGTDGLEVVYNGEYIHNDMAILFTAASWLSVDPGSGWIEPYSSDTITAGFDAAALSDGEYNGLLSITSNDPDTPNLDVTVTLTVTSEPIAPNAPNLVFPENEATDVSQPLTIDWSDVSNADSYQLMMDTDESFTSAKMDSNMVESQCDVDGLEQGMMYYWKVRAQNEIDWSDWSEVRNFTTEITWICGDFDNNSLINILDVTGFIAYLYKDGTPPVFMQAADVDGNSAVNILDVTTLIAFLYQEGPPLNCP